MDVWWIDEPHLLGSCNPTTADLEELRAQGFSMIVSLLEEDLQPPKYDLARVEAIGYTRRNIAVMEFHSPDVEQLLEFVDLMRRLPEGTKAILHCQAGIGRTGTFAAAYWIAKGLTVDEALARVGAARPLAVETREQRDALDEFARKRASM
jgi:atypical dual specificity phosphatase